jgi:hypothetical protein
MDFEAQLKKLQTTFTYALSNSVTAKARYLALIDEPSAMPAQVARAKLAWQQIEARKASLVAQMVAIEELEAECAE